MKIAIFENEYQQVEAAFQVVNLLHYNNSLQIQTFPSSQSIGDLDKIKDFDVVIVDIDLSQKSNLDGYSLLRRIEDLDKKTKILILTGSSKVEQTLKEKKLPPYDILLKPLDFNILHESLNKVLSHA